MNTIATHAAQSIFKINKEIPVRISSNRWCQTINFRYIGLPKIVMSRAVRIIIRNNSVTALPAEVQGRAGYNNRSDALHRILFYFTR